MIAKVDVVSESCYFFFIVCDEMDRAMPTGESVVDGSTTAGNIAEPAPESSKKYPARNNC